MHHTNGCTHHQPELVTIMLETYGFHPRSDGLAKRMPARETVAGVAAFRWPISNISRMEGERGTRSLLARVNTWENGNRKHFASVVHGMRR